MSNLDRNNNALGFCGVIFIAVAIILIIGSSFPNAQSIPSLQYKDQSAYASLVGLPLLPPNSNNAPTSIGIHHQYFIHSTALYSAPIFNSIPSRNTLANSANKVVVIDDGHTAKGISNQSIESVMGTLISPKSLMVSAINQIRNGAAKNNTLLHTNSGITIVRDSFTVLLSHQILPPKDFMHIYDSTPYKITNGHLTAKLSCDTNFESPIKILVGELTNLKPAKLEIVEGLSKPGYMCMYYVNIASSGLLAKSGKTTITDITLFNPTGYRVVLLNTSTIVVGVNEIMPLSNKIQ